jgi:DNA-binding NarL/FixJ family response regulator
MSFPAVPRVKPDVNVVVLSPHRLVPLALRAAGRTDGSYDVIGAAVTAEEALDVIHATCPDVLVFDPTAVSLGKCFQLLEKAAPFLRLPTSVVLLLEPAQAATTIAARFMWEAGARCAMTSQEAPDIWPVAIMAAVRGGTYVSPVAGELFGLSRVRAVEPMGLLGGGPHQRMAEGRQRFAAGVQI